MSLNKQISQKENLKHFFRKIECFQPQNLINFFFKFNKWKIDYLNWMKKSPPFFSQMRWSDLHDWTKKYLEQIQQPQEPVEC